jgi:hypothetical protein
LSGEAAGPPDIAPAEGEDPSEVRAVFGVPVDEFALASAAFACPDDRQSSPLAISKIVFMSISSK